MSNAGSEDFGQFLEKVNDSPPVKGANLLPRPNVSNNRPRVVTRTSAKVPSRAFQLPEPTSGSMPFRIRTRRPINLRLVPPPESSAIPDTLRSHDGPISTGLPAAGEAAGKSAGEGASNFRIFTREQVRQFKIPRPPSSVLSGRSNVTPDDTTNNFTINNALRWRLRGLRGDNASATDLRVLEESDRFSLGSFESSRAGLTNGTGSEGITTGIRRALNSQYVHTGQKRRKQAADDEASSDSDPPKFLDQLSDEPRSGVEASGGSENEGDLNIGISDELAEDANSGIEESSDNDNLSARSARPPSRLSSESIQIDSDSLYVDGDATRAGTNGENGRYSELDSNSNSERLRPRDPHEIEGPLIFDVPVSEMPNIDWGADDVDIDGQFLEQQLEHSESESDEESDAGSVAEIIDDSSDDDATYLNSTEVEKEWNPNLAMQEIRGNVLSDDSSDSDDDRVEALTESEGESDTNDCVDSDADIVESVSVARRNRGKRNRIPRVNFWLGERIEYERLGKRELMTAIDVHRVEPPKKTYRKRRSHRQKRTAQTQIFDELEANADQKVVMVPVFDTASREWRDRTVARSIAGLDFAPVLAEDGARIPMVTRCVLFGGKQDSAPLRLCVLRIEPGGVFSSSAEQNKASTFVVWRGKCTVHLNNHEFDLMKGMACLVPRGNDFFVDNGGGDRLSTGDVFLFITEINAEANPELADAMAKDAQSMISGAAAISNFFESDHGSSDHGSPANGNYDDTMPQDNQKFTSSIGEDDLNAVDDFNESDANDSNETRETFGHGFARALGSDSGASKDVPHAPHVRPQLLKPLTQAAHSHPPPESLRSFSYALGSDREFSRPPPSSPKRSLARPSIKPEQEEFDTFDMLDDYLEGRKGNPKRLILNERSVVNREELRVRTYLENLSENHSNLSHDLN